MPSKPAPAASARPASADPFFEAYDRAQPAYGLCPSTELASYLSQCPTTGAALDLGAGAGRDTLTLARAGFQVTAVDASSRGLERIRQRAAAAGVADRVETVHCDIRDLRIPAGSYRTIVATTVLDHIPGEDAERIWPRITAGLAAEGALFVEVHTTDDPGSPSGTGAATDAPVSETAQWVVNYFPPGKLLRTAAADSRLRVLRYEERLEWITPTGPSTSTGRQRCWPSQIPAARPRALPPGTATQSSSPAARNSAANRRPVPWRSHAGSSPHPLFRPLGSLRGVRRQAASKPVLQFASPELQLARLGRRRPRGGVDQEALDRFRGAATGHREPSRLRLRRCWIDGVHPVLGPKRARRILLPYLARCGEAPATACVSASQNRPSFRGSPSIHSPPLQ